MSREISKYICPRCDSMDIQRQETKTHYLLECQECGLITRPIRKEK